MNILDIQFRVHQHCVRYNADIYNFKTAEKIQHYALVIGRLSSDYFQMRDEPNNAAHGVVLFLNVCTIANFLNVDLPKKAMTDGRVLKTLQENIDYWHQHPGLDQKMILIKYIGAMGTYCKIAEAIDHMEPMDFRTEVNKVLIDLYHLSFCMLALAGTKEDYAKYLLVEAVRDKEFDHHAKDALGLFSLDDDLYLPF